jgi:predicted transcriptional regulator of viral defense system
MGSTPEIARDVLENLAATGINHFTTAQFAAHLGRPVSATHRALDRLRSKKLVATPYPGFHVSIRDPEYRPFGCLPPEQWVPQLMEHLGRSYYVGFLSAGRWHGAAHQKPMVFQVVVPQAMRDITCGRVRVDFITRGNAAQIPTELRKTPRGFFKISTPEATAFDLVGYPLHAGGLSNAATVLTELGESIDAQKLVDVAPLSPVAWAQRLGYILDLLEDTSHLTGPLAQFVAANTYRYVPLRVRKPHEDAARDTRWKILVNTEIEPDL